MKRKGTEPVEFDFEVFKELSNYERTSMNDFYLALKSVGSKLGSLSYKFEDESYYEQLWLFQRFAIDKENKKIIIQANERFEFILNSIGTNFTRFELENVTKLTSGYSKELYRQLMQHRDGKTRKGAWFVKVEDFREVLAILNLTKCPLLICVFLKLRRKNFLQVTESIIPFFHRSKLKK